MKKKPRVLFIATFPPPVHGSAVVSQQIMDSNTINNTFKPYYVNISSSKRIAELGRFSPIKILRIISSYFVTFWMLLRHHYDLCYCAITINGSCFLRDSIYVLLCKLFRRKVLIHQHNKGMSNYVNKPIYRWLYKACYKDTKVILLSWHLYNDISSIVPKENCMVCFNGIAPTNQIKMTAEMTDIPHILFLSNLIESKGPLVLLDACKQLKEKGYKFHCDYIGGDTQEISVTRFNEMIVGAGLESSVTYHGKVYGADKDAFWSRADMFVFPTFYYNECFPLVLLEAMEKGKACISTVEGGIRDIITDGVTGLIVERNNVDSLASAIEKLINDRDLCRRMGEEGKHRYEKLFTQVFFEKRMCECLESCI